MNLADFQRPPKGSYAYSALRCKQPVVTPLGTLHVELHMVEDRKPADDTMLELAAKLVSYAQHNNNRLLDLIYGAYRFWAIVKEDPGWLPYSVVPADLMREQIGGYCEVRLVVSRHAAGAKIPYDTEILVIPKWDDGEIFTFTLREGEIIAANHWPFTLDNGVLLVESGKAPPGKRAETQKTESDFKKLPSHVYPMTRNACRRQPPLETPLGECEVELHMAVDKLPPDDEMLQLSAELVHYAREQSEYLRDVIYGAYRYWVGLRTAGEDGADFPANLMREEIASHCEVRLVVTRWAKHCDTEIWLLPKWGQEYNVILKVSEGGIVTANDSPFELENGVLKFVEADKKILGLLDDLSTLVAQIEIAPEPKAPEGAVLKVPVFGKLVRVEWPGLLAFREFPFFRQFGDPDPRSADGQPCINHLEPDEREAVENWRNPTPKLAAISNNGLVCACLHSQSVFDLAVAVPEDGLPTKAQEAAYKEFLAQEEKVCATVLDALIRYYHFARETIPDAFDWMDEGDLVEKPNATEFAKLARFHGLTVCGGAAKGVAPIRFSWSPIWDDEHGLVTILYRGQVIAIGAEAGDLLTRDPKEFLQENEEYGGWGVKQMNADERKALEEFVSSYERPRDEE